jgi:hypothetical protein
MQVNSKPFSSFTSKVWPALRGLAADAGAGAGFESLS